MTAVTALNSGDIDSAIRLLEASIEMSPENDAAYYYLSLCHASKKDMAKAETFMKKTSIISYTAPTLYAAADGIITLAEAEGLTAHANAIRKRVGK